jgi:hypothetical protein
MRSSFAAVVNFVTAESLSSFIIKASILSVNGTTVIRTGNPDSSTLKAALAAKPGPCEL